MLEAIQTQPAPAKPWPLATRGEPLRGGVLAFDRHLAAANPARPAGNQTQARYPASRPQHEGRAEAVTELRPDKAAAGKVAPQCEPVGSNSVTDRTDTAVTSAQDYSEAHLLPTVVSGPAHATEGGGLPGPVLASTPQPDPGFVEQGPSDPKLQSDARTEPTGHGSARATEFRPLAGSQQQPLGPGVWPADRLEAEIGVRGAAASSYRGPHRSAAVQTGNTPSAHLDAPVTGPARAQAQAHPPPEPVVAGPWVQMAPAVVRASAAIDGLQPASAGALPPPGANVTVDPPPVSAAWPAAPTVSASASDLARWALRFGQADREPAVSVPGLVQPASLAAATMADPAHAAPESNGAAPLENQADDGADPATMTRILRGLRSALNQRGGSVTLRLNPPKLGFVRIRLQLAQGHVRAEFASEHAAVRSMLMSQAGQLRVALEAHGLQVEPISWQTLPANAHQRAWTEQDERRDGAFQQHGGHHDRQHEKFPRDEDPTTAGSPDGSDPPLRGS